MTSQVVPAPRPKAARMISGTEPCHGPFCGFVLLLWFAIRCDFSTQSSADFVDAILLCIARKLRCVGSDANNPAFRVRRELRTHRSSCTNHLVETADTRDSRMSHANAAGVSGRSLLQSTA